MKLIADSTLSSLKLVASISNSSSSVSIKSNTRTTNSFFRPVSGSLRCYKNSLSFSTVHDEGSVPYHASKNQCNSPFSYTINVKNLLPFTVDLCDLWWALQCISSIRIELDTRLEFELGFETGCLKWLVRVRIRRIYNRIKFDSCGALLNTLVDAAMSQHKSSNQQ